MMTRRSSKIQNYEARKTLSLGSSVVVGRITLARARNAIFGVTDTAKS